MVLELEAAAARDVVVVGAHAGAGEEHRAREALVVVVADDEAGQGVREVVRAQHAVAGVDERTPRAADAAGHGQASWRQPAEDVREHVVGEQLHLCYAISVTRDVDVRTWLSLF